MVDCGGYGGTADDNEKAAAAHARWQTLANLAVGSTVVDCTRTVLGVKAVVGQLYRHVKRGGIYKVKDIVLRESNHVVEVTYQDQEDPSQLPWSRPLSEFQDGRFQWVPKFGEDDQD